MSAVGRDPVLTYGKEDDAIVRPWARHDRTMAQTGVRTMARQLPGLLRLAWSLAWEADRRGLVVMVVLRALAGVLTAVLRDGPTPQRLHDALPALVFVIAAGTLRSGLAAATNLVRVRLGPGWTGSATSGCSTWPPVHRSWPSMTRASSTTLTLRSGAPPAGASSSTTRSRC